MYCINGDGRPVENKDTGLCSSCSRALRKGLGKMFANKYFPIRKASSTMEGLIRQYSKKKDKFIIGKKCACKTLDHDCVGTLSIHHMQGRVGYADEHAREIEMPLLLDERFWLPVCLNAHRYIEEHPKWACENGYSFLRVTDPIFRKQK